LQNVYRAPRGTLLAHLPFEGEQGEGKQYTNAHGGDTTYTLESVSFRRARVQSLRACLAPVSVMTGGGAGMDIHSK
jgi:hypothetical protein